MLQNQVYDEKAYDSQTTGEWILLCMYIKVCKDYGCRILWHFQLYIYIYTDDKHKVTTAEPGYPLPVLPWGRRVVVTNEILSILFGHPILPTTSFSFFWYPSLNIKQSLRTKASSIHYKEICMFVQWKDILP